jgi:rhomboid protease GluP
MSRYPVTITFILLLLVIYALTTYPDFHSISRHWLTYLALSQHAVTHAEYWRLLTGNLVHADTSHLLNNLFGFLIFGRLLESSLTTKAMLILIAVSLVGTDVMTLLFSDAPSIGASGIVMGFTGAYLSLVLLLRRQTDPALFRQELRGFIGFIVIFLIWNWLEQDRVNVWGHVGGFIAGVLFSMGYMAGFARKAAVLAPESVPQARDEAVEEDLV